jgi:OmpA-OmpF porin, OOP family
MNIFKIIVIWLLTFLSIPLVAQNLVPNPSFEEVVRCPHGFSESKKDFIVPGWESPTTGTPDHFHVCSWGDADVPFNWAGSSNARTGKAYAGIYVWNKRDDDKSYREYIQCELAEALVQGEEYVLEFYFKLAPNSVYSCNRMGLALSTLPIQLNHDQTIDLPTVISIEKDTAVTGETGSWERAFVIYKAKGGERYLIIGNFFNNKSTKSTRLPFRIGKNAMLTHSAYYYIDDVTVKALDSLKQKIVPVPSPDFVGEAIELNRDYILKNIQFEFDSYVLHRASFIELDKVVNYLKSNRDVRVRLAGHTDYMGSHEYNITLSRNRARSVADYLISKGIDSQRVVSYGFGKTRPLVSDKTDEARKINRRVEVRFVTQAE